MVFWNKKTGTTPEGFPVDETGKVQGLDDLGMDTSETAAGIHVVRNMTDSGVST